MSYRPEYCTECHCNHALDRPCGIENGAIAQFVSAELAGTFGEEWTALSPSDRALIVRDVLEDGSPLSYPEYRRNIGAGNLQSYRQGNASTFREDTMKAWITYSKVDEESAAEGDCCEHGFYDPGMGEFPLDVVGEEAGRIKEENALRVKEAIGWATGRAWQPSSCPKAGPGDWWDTIDEELDYRTGESTTYSLHLEDSVTPSSWRRVDRLLRGK